MAVIDANKEETCNESKSFAKKPEADLAGAVVFGGHRVPQAREEGEDL